MTCRSSTRLPYAVVLFNGVKFLYRNGVFVQAKRD